MFIHSCCYEARGASLYLYTCRVPQHVIFVSNAIINTPTRWQHSYRVPSIITRGADKPHQNLQKTPREEKEERVLMQRPGRHHSIPNPLRNHSNLSRARGFVNPSAICSAVGTYFNSTIPASWTSPCHLRWMSMCFVREWYCGFEDRAIAPWLSPQMIVAALPWPEFSSLSNRLSHIASLVACVCPINSASQVERATTLCLLDCQLIAPLPMLNR
jgi:hypothetical protein